jgi:hypothetical protein
MMPLVLFGFLADARFSKLAKQFGAAVKSWLYTCLNEILLAYVHCHNHAAFVQSHCLKIVLQ